MILILASALALISESVVCDLTPQGHDIPQHGPTGFTVACPADHEDAAAIQSAAEAAIAAIILPLPRPGRQDGNPPPRLWAASELTMQLGNGSWRPALAQPMVRAIPWVPRQAIQQGAAHMLCALAFTPDASGVDQQPGVACISDVSTDLVERHQRASMTQAASLWRFAPVPVPYCFNHQLLTSATPTYPATRRRQPPPAIPDPDLLPNLCEAG
ncbi:hypothetical protein AB6B38_10095 [Glycocaulis abyssi]|uniref:hypothetical protein n=1 Tax=Glycocaulis abyssi TaxID=1433403 RepID=UPI00352B9C9A